MEGNEIFYPFLSGEQKRPRQVRPPASAVVIQYDDGDAAPSDQRWRFEDTLRRLCPPDSSVIVCVDVRWSIAHSGWILLSASALAADGASQDLTLELAAACVDALVPLLLSTASDQRWATC